MLLVVGKSLTALAESRGFKVTNDTIKMSLEIDHPYSSSDKSLEINFSNPNKPWIGFSYNTSTEEKHSFAIKERAKCESYLKYIDYQDGSPNELMHHSDDKSYVGKGKPGVKNSYLFYCINCPKEDKEKLDALEDLSEVSRGDRRGRFLRLKKRRANNITDELDLLGNLSIKANYDYNQEEIDDLYYLLMDSLKHTFSLFDAGFVLWNGLFAPYFDPLLHGQRCQCSPQKYDRGDRQYRIFLYPDALSGPRRYDEWIA